LTDDDILDFVPLAYWKDRFWKLVTKTDDCWFFGMGRLSRPSFFGGVLAHRWMWIYILNNPIPEGMHIHHECKTPLCVRPDHLRLLTPKQYVQRHVEMRKEQRPTLISRGFDNVPDVLYAIYRPVWNQITEKGGVWPAAG
jgi:hypothetical protein